MMAKLKTRYVCQACGSEQHPLAGAMPRLRRMEHAGPGSERRDGLFGASTICRAAGGRSSWSGSMRWSRCPSGCGPGSPSSTARSAAGSCRDRRCWSAAIPGIGKSTLLLQVAAKLAAGGRKVVYVSGEEAADQVRLRAIRLGLGDAPVQLAAATSVRDILTTVSDGEPPALLVIDSIQTMHSDLIEGAPGTVSQVRASAQELVRFAKERGTAVVLVGHVTKDGTIAGPRVLEHMVDTVLGFEGERSHQYRILRAAKNRFGGTDEIGVFAMEGGGLSEVPNPSALFLTQRGEPVSGTSVFPALEGTRPVLVEIQALTVRLASGATPRRAAVGWDSGRLAMVLAVLEARCGMQLRDGRSLSQRRRRLSAERPGGRPGGRRGAGVGAERAAGAAGRGGDGRNRAVGRGPAGRACGRCGSRKSAKLGFDRAWVPAGTEAPSGIALTRFDRLRELVEQILGR